MLTRRHLIRLLAAAVPATALFAEPSADWFGSPAPFPGSPLDYHGFAMHNFTLDGCAAHAVQPAKALKGRPWVWRTMFWDAFPAADLALLKAGFHLAFIDVGNTFGCPDAMKHFDAFYSAMTGRCKLSKKPALEGLSRGGLYAYRWAFGNTEKVGCIYGDAPVCDMKSWPGGKGKGAASPKDWQQAISVYHFSSEQQMMDFTGNPIDILAPLAAARIPVIHVCGDADRTVPEEENTDIVRTRYRALGGEFTLIVKEGCDHHPHGLADPAPVINFIVGHCAQGKTARESLDRAPRPGSVTRLPQGQW